MSWQQNANMLLLSHVLTGRDRGIDYAPDNGGQHTVYIGRILHAQAQAWATDQAEARADNVKTDGRATWADAMRLADERIRAYLQTIDRARAA